MSFNRYAAPIILNRYSTIFVKHHSNLGTITSHCLVDTIIDHLINELVQPICMSVSNVHAGTFSYSLEPFQNRNRTRIVFFIICHCRHALSHFYPMRNTMSRIENFF
ncbi:MAG: hypothetical protein ACD_17C00189G0001 [uncultured bacterium]|nr:MAG: hypothetical protein ACD_17C00189G0001 [uncultured bacterium]